MASQLRYILNYILDSGQLFSELYLSRKKF